MTDGRSILSTIVQTAVVDLFREYGIAVAPLPLRAVVPNASVVYLGATINYKGKSMSGSLALYVPEVVLAVARQAAGVSFKLEDFTRELVNQLLGRLKNRILTYQIDLKAGLPSILAQNTYGARRDDKPDCLDFVFRSLRGEVFVSLRGTIDYGAIVYSGARVGGVEGDVILF